MARRDRPRPCPCGSGALLEACCGPLLAGAGEPATPEELMRSRYSAFALGDAGYLSRTWHPATRPADLALDPSTRWTRLEVLATSGGSLLESSGTVSFRAHWREGSRTGVLEETSRFHRVQGRWVYVAPQ